MQANALYAYCGNSPLIYSDPSGNGLVSSAIGGVITIIGGLLGLTSCDDQSVPESESESESVPESEYDPSKSTVYVPGSGVELTKDNLSSFYFDTEFDAAIAFGYVYGGSTSLEYGASIDYDPVEEKYYVRYVYSENTDDPQTSVTIIHNDNTSATSHTHPWSFSRYFSKEDLNSKKTDYLIVQNGDVYVAIYNQDKKKLIGPHYSEPNAETEPIATTSEWFSGAYQSGEIADLIESRKVEYN